MIELAGVSHRFDDSYVLRGIDLRLAERRIAIIGANGSGKSTFARLLNALIVPTEGTVRVDGLDTRSEPKAVRRRVGFVFQNPDHQIVLPTVEEDVAFGLRNLKLPKDEIAHRVTDVLARYGLAALRTRSAHLLSGGEKQLLAIASVVVMQPATIVFDEPTTLLDLRNTRLIRRVIADLPQRVIAVSHDLEVVRDFERVLVFDQGRIVADDMPAPALARYVAAVA
jgi:biotin transport system ATP-binding protein